jgi:hypothetical protein
LCYPEHSELNERGDMNYWFIGYVIFACITFVMLFGMVMSVASKDRSYRGKAAVVLLTLVAVGFVSAVWPLTYVLLAASNMSKGAAK